MILKFADWIFDVDIAATMEHTANNSTDHCDCAYCQNYYRSVDSAYPQLRPFLARFGILLEGPSELMPFEPTLMLACYRVYGQLLQHTEEDFYLDAIRFLPEPAEDGTFLLWVGELDLPWLMDEDMDEVVSPANLPEFMDRMRSVWLKRTGGEFVFS